jgi:hypothetical protein
MAMDWLSYINQNPDLQAAGLKSEADAMWHWNTYGKNEGRQVGMQESTSPLGMVAAGQTATNRPGTGLDASGNLLPGWKYVTYSNGVGQGTPVNTGAALNAFGAGSSGAQLSGLSGNGQAPTPGSTFGGGSPAVVGPTPPGANRPWNQGNEANALAAALRLRGQGGGGFQFGGMGGSFMGRPFTPSRQPQMPGGSQAPYMGRYTQLLNALARRYGGGSSRPTGSGLMAMPSLYGGYRP